MFVSNVKNIFFIQIKHYLIKKKAQKVFFLDIVFLYS